VRNSLCYRVKEFHYRGQASLAPDEVTTAALGTKITLPSSAFSFVILFIFIPSSFRKQYHFLEEKQRTQIQA